MDLLFSYSLSVFLFLFWHLLRSEGTLCWARPWMVCLLAVGSLCKAIWDGKIEVGISLIYKHNASFTTGSPQPMTTVGLQCGHLVSHYMATPDFMIFFAVAVKWIMSPLSESSFSHRFLLVRSQLGGSQMVITWHWDALNIINICWLHSTQIMITWPWECCNNAKCKDTSKVTLFSTVITLNSC